MMLRKISVNHDYLRQSRKYTYLAQSHVARMVFYGEQAFNICLTQQSKNLLYFNSNIIKSQASTGNFLFVRLFGVSLEKNRQRAFKIST